MPQKTYKATGINLKTKPFGEADRLVTILTKEQGLVRLIAPNARKQKSSLTGRSGLFVVNELLISQGKSMDKILQAETIESFPKLAIDLKKLTAAQYLAELVLQQALSDHPQVELFYLFLEHLSRIEAATAQTVLPHLTHAAFQLLAIAGVAPQMYRCCLSGDPIEPEIGNPTWRIAFSVEAGGAVTLSALEEWQAEKRAAFQPDHPERIVSHSAEILRVAERPVQFASRKRIDRPTQLGAVQVSILQQLATPQLPHLDPDCLPQGLSSDLAWLSIERLLRQCAYYHFDHAIRSAKLIESLFGSASPSAPNSP